MTRPYSVAFKQKMVRRLIGKNATTATALARETGVRQQNLSRWLDEARSLAGVASDKPTAAGRTVEQKARIVAETAQLEGDELAAYLQREGVRLADLERWRAALDDRESGARVQTKQIRDLQRELARKEKALAEAAALLILKKKVEGLYPADEDDDTDGENEK